MREELMFVTFKRLLANESGATAIEYGLICAFIAVAILTALKVVGTELIASLTLLLGAFG
jgi:pilus assembly protein Flp/PilA